MDIKDLMGEIDNANTLKEEFEKQEAIRKEQAQKKMEESVRSLTSEILGSTKDVLDVMNYAVEKALFDEFPRDAFECFNKVNASEQPYKWQLYDRENSFIRFSEEPSSPFPRVDITVDSVNVNTGKVSCSFALNDDSIEAFPKRVNREWATEAVDALQKVAKCLPPYVERLSNAIVEDVQKVKSVLFTNDRDMSKAVADNLALQIKEFDSKGRNFNRLIHSDIHCQANHPKSLSPAKLIYSTDSGIKMNKWDEHTGGLIYQCTVTEKGISGVTYDDGVASPIEYDFETKDCKNPKGLCEPMRDLKGLMASPEMLEAVEKQTRNNKDKDFER